DYHGDERSREEPRVFIGTAVQTHRVAQRSQHECAREKAKEIEPRPRDRTQFARFDRHHPLQGAHKRAGLRFVHFVIVRAHAVRKFAASLRIVRSKLAGSVSGERARLARWFLRPAETSFRTRPSGGKTRDSRKLSESPTRETRALPRLDSRGGRYACLRYKSLLAGRRSDRLFRPALPQV